MPPPAVPPPAAPPPTATVAAPAGCASSPLPLPPDTGGIDIRGVDPTQRYIVAISYRGADETALLWHGDGQPQVVAGAEDVTVEDVNASGVIAGTRHAAGPAGAGGAAGDRAVLIRDGQVRVLPMPAGALSTSAVAINTRGDVAGTALLEAGSQRAVVWRAGAAAPVLLPVEARTTTAAAINDDGVVIGNAGDIRHGYAWAPDGTAKALPVPTGYLKAEARAVTGDWALGWADAAPIGKDGHLVDDPAHPSRGVRWNLRTGAVDILAKMVDPMAVGGSGATAGAIDGTGRPSIWRDGTVFVLPMPMPDPAPSVIDWIGPDGHTMIGTVRHQDLGVQLAVWRGC